MESCFTYKIAFFNFPQTDYKLPSVAIKKKKRKTIMKIKVVSSQLEFHRGILWIVDCGRVGNGRNLCTCNGQIACLRKIARVFARAKNFALPKFCTCQKFRTCQKLSTSQILYVPKISHAPNFARAKSFERPRF